MQKSQFATNWNGLQVKARACGFLSPSESRNVLQQNHVSLVDRLRAVPSVELLWIDSRERTVNGLLLADSFDFA